MRFSRGSLQLGRLRGAPIRIHWTTPLGALVFGRLEWVPGFWLGFVALVLVHELGHALVVRATGHRVVAVDVHGLGGVCHWEGDATPLARASIAWGGVWGQLALLAVTVVALLAFGRPASPFTAELVAAFTTTNLALMAINLMPIRPLDGAEAWALPRLLWARRRARRAFSQRQAVARAREIEARIEIAALEEHEEMPLTAEVQDVLERAREIARREVEASRSKDPGAASLPGRDRGRLADPRLDRSDDE